MSKVIKFKHTLPFYLETRLINKLGFYIQGRVYKETITVGKHISLKSDANVIQPTKQTELKLVVSNLTPAVQADLEKRCDNIVCFFHDPYNSIGPLRQRLHNMMQGLRTLEERQYILEYMDENFPLEGNA